jgi:hypothetical protein
MFKIKGPRTEYQVTVSKRLTFWNGSLMYHGVGKVSGIFLQKKWYFLLLSSCALWPSISLPKAQDWRIPANKIGIKSSQVCCSILSPLFKLIFCILAMTKISSWDPCTPYLGSRSATRPTMEPAPPILFICRALTWGALTGFCAASFPWPIRTKPLL